MATETDPPDDTRPEHERPAFVPETADEAEAAAIVAAVSAHLAAESTETEAAPAWEGRRWAFAARSEALVGRPLQAPKETPTDAWTAVGRADRL